LADRSAGALLRVPEPLGFTLPDGLLVRIVLFALKGKAHSGVHVFRVGSGWEHDEEGGEIAGV
jgi:hypothetical protein